VTSVSAIEEIAAAACSGLPPSSLFSLSVLLLLCACCCCLTNNCSIFLSIAQSCWNCTRYPCSPYFFWIEIMHVPVLSPESSLCEVVSAIVGVVHVAFAFGVLWLLLLLFRRIFHSSTHPRPIARPRRKLLPIDEAGCLHERNRKRQRRRRQQPIERSLPQSDRMAQFQQQHGKRDIHVVIGSRFAITMALAVPLSLLGPWMLFFHKAVVLVLDHDPVEDTRDSDTSGTYLLLFGTISSQILLFPRVSE